MTHSNRLVQSDETELKGRTAAEDRGSVASRHETINRFSLTMAFFQPLPLLVVLTLFILVACGTARHGEPVAEPFHPKSDNVVRGERIFLTHCDACHPGGEARVGFAINNKPLPGSMIKTQVRCGVGAMPSFSKELISNEELDDVVEYLKALRTHAAK